VCGANARRKSTYSDVSRHLGGKDRSETVNFIFRGFFFTPRGAFDKGEGASSHKKCLHFYLYHLEFFYPISHNAVWSTERCWKRASSVLHKTGQPHCTIIPFLCAWSVRLAAERSDMKVGYRVHYLSAHLFFLCKFFTSWACSIFFKPFLSMCTNGLYSWGALLLPFRP